MTSGDMVIRNLICELTNADDRKLKETKIFKDILKICTEVLEDETITDKTQILSFRIREYIRLIEEKIDSLGVIYGPIQSEVLHDTLYYVKKHINVLEKVKNNIIQFPLKK